MSSEVAPRVSVVMGVYNGGSQVRKSIESILQQTLDQFEFLIIDDGSTDQTPQILDEYAAEDSRVRVIRAENRGLTRALIDGCGRARAEFIARQDADDWSHPTRLQLQAELLNAQPSLGFVSCPTEYVGPHGEYLETVTRPTDSEVATRQLLEQRQGPPAHGTVMFRKKLYDQLGGYRPQFYFAQDADLWLRMAEVSQIGYTREVGYTFVRGINSITGQQRSVQQEFGRLGQACRQARRRGESEIPFLDEADRLRQAVQAGSIQESSPRNHASALYGLGSQLVRNRDSAARRYLWSAVRSQPMHWRAWLRLLQSYCLTHTKS